MSGNDGSGPEDPYKKLKDLLKMLADEVERLDIDERRRADEASKKADEAIKKADEASKKANEAIKKADEAIKKADEASEKANEADEGADYWEDRIDRATMRFKCPGCPKTYSGFGDCLVNHMIEEHVNEDGNPPPASEATDTVKQKYECPYCPDRIFEKPTESEKKKWKTRCGNANYAKYAQLVDHIREHARERVESQEEGEGDGSGELSERSSGDDNED